MHSIQFSVFPVPEILKNDVECFRVVSYAGDEGLAIKVSPNATPGIVFQHGNALSPLENIITPSRSNSDIPPLFLYGAGTEPSVMNYRPGAYTTTQVIFKPHALKTLLGINALAVTNSGLVDLQEFSAKDLNERLLEARNAQECICLLTDFLLTKRVKTGDTRDTLVEESLRLIHKSDGCVTVSSLLEYLNISERQFERRFSQTVGVSPQSYIRVKRFNEAIRLIKTGQYRQLSDVAYALGFYDQSHLIHEITAFSGMTPKNLSQKEDASYHSQAGYSYV